MAYTWKQFFEKEKQEQYYIDLHQKVMEEYNEYTIYPPYNLILNAYKLTPFENTKVVLLGQDPYHNPNQAMGLAFSVPHGIKVPPSLVNIYKEIGAEYNTTINQDGDLTYLAEQGVLLLNALLTVRENQPMSHKGYGYEILLEHTLIKLDEDDNPKVFILWGGAAKKMLKFLKNPKHLILTSAHPSPLSAYNGFFGNNHFIKTNEFLRSNNREEINWIKK
jgi:uracil-DNA glycosylase